MHQNTISNNFQKCPKLCGTFLPFHSHFTRYIRKEKCLPGDSLKFIFSRGFHRDQGDHICFFLKAFPSKLIECVRIKHAGDFFCCPPSSRAAMKRLQSRDNSLLLEGIISKCHCVIDLYSLLTMPWNCCAPPFLPCPVAPETFRLRQLRQFISKFDQFGNLWKPKVVVCSSLWSSTSSKVATNNNWMSSKSTSSTPTPNLSSTVSTNLLLSKSYQQEYLHLRLHFDKINFCIALYLTLFSPGVRLFGPESASK